MSDLIWKQNGWNNAGVDLEDVNWFKKKRPQNYLIILDLDQICSQNVLQ